MANGWLNTEVPNWLAARTQRIDPTQEVISAMRFGADQRQRNIDNALELKEFGAQQESRNLQNTLAQMRIDADANDSKALAEWLPQFNAASGDTLRTLPLPALKDASRLQGLQLMVNRKIDSEAGTTAQRIAATTRDAYLKDVESLDPQWRGTALEYLNNNGIPNEEAWNYLDYAKRSTSDRAEAAKLRVTEAQQKFIESRQLAVEKVKNQYRAGVRGAASITDKAKLSAFNNELHQITFDPLLTTEEKTSKQQDVMSKYGVSPNFAEGDAAVAAPALDLEAEQSIWDSEIANIDRQIEKQQVDLAKSPGKALTDFGTDNRVLKIQELQTQRKALESAKTKAPAATVAPERVRVRSKDGKIGTVPRSQLEQAQKEGYSIVE